jgi:hypothetical protein
MQCFKFFNSEKKELKRFWTNLRSAVNNPKSNNLHKLCFFPFTTTFCITDTSKRPYFSVNKNNFAKYKNCLFYSSNFVETINKIEIIDILQTGIAENGSCILTFSFPIIRSSTQGEGLQGFYSLKRINGKYRIISAWTVP